MRLIHISTDGPILLLAIFQYQQVRLIPYANSTVSGADYSFQYQQVRLIPISLPPKQVSQSHFQYQQVRLIPDRGLAGQAFAGGLSIPAGAIDSTRYVTTVTDLRDFQYQQVRLIPRLG